MITKTFAALTAITVALALAVVPALNDQVYAQDCNGCNGQGHQKDTGCTQGNPDFPECPGESAKNNPNRDDCTVVFSGNSDNIKFEDPEGCSQDI
jgi:hypothetical protein